MFSTHLGSRRLSVAHIFSDLCESSVTVRFVPLTDIGKVFASLHSQLPSRAPCARFCTAAVRQSIKLRRRPHEQGLDDVRRRIQATQKSSVTKAVSPCHPFNSVFDEAGLSVGEQHYQYYDQRVTNVVATVPTELGRLLPRRRSLRHVPGTPGADDNASAVAVTLELARHFQQEQLKAPLLFAAFTLAGQILAWARRTVEAPLLSYHLAEVCFT